jgi:Fe-S cluster assembly protein SufB
MSNSTESIAIDRDVGNFFYNIPATREAGVGLTEKTIDYIVDAKGEPEWLREFRKNAYHIFKSKPLPTHWAGDELNEIDFDVIRYYLAAGDSTKRTWEEVPEDIKRTFERLGIPESERKFLAGVEAQFDSEAVYSNIKKAVADQGVIFMGSTDALKERPDLFRKWFGKVIPTGDNKFSSLNSAVFSGGSFIYVPPGVIV